MIPETASTRLRNPEKKKIYRTNSNVFLESESPFDYQFTYEDEGYWVVRDPQTGIFGHGAEPSEALADFHLAAVQHLEVLEQEPALSAELSWQLEYLRARIER